MSARIVSCHLLLIVTLIGSNLLGLLPQGPTVGLVSEAHAASVSAFLDSEDFTFVAWVYWEGGAPWQRIFDFGQDTTRNMFLTPRSGDDTLRFAITTSGVGGEEQLNAPGPLPTDQWVHVAVTLDGDSGQLYLDGASVDSHPIILNPSDIGGSLRWLAKSQYAVDPYFNGLLDEVAVFDRALSQTEIQGVMASGWDSLPGQTLALYMEEDPASAGTLITDSSGQGNHGRLITADGTNKSSPGKLGQALSFDGLDDYLALSPPLYVRPGGSGDCLSWASACELQTALGIAAAGDWIWVAQGIYKPTTGTDRTISFQLKNGVALYGGFPATGEPGWGDRDWQANLTVLSGDIDNDDVTDDDGVIINPDSIQGDNSYHVVYTYGTDASTILDGFTITGGKADGALLEENAGGGMYNDGGSPTLNNVAFRSNTAPYYCCPSGSGGGMYNDGGSPTLNNVTFSDNEAGGAGGGMFYYGSGSPTLNNVNFYYNGADRLGGGMWRSRSDSHPNVGSVTLTDVTFLGNSSWHAYYGSPGHGGGMYNLGDGATLTNVSFVGNSADIGGGMYNYNGSPVLTHVTFRDNVADGTYYDNANGGGMYSEYSNPQLTDVTFSGNTASEGGGMHNSNNSHPQLTDVIFSGNTANTDGGGMRNINSSPTLTGVTFSSNTAGTGGGGMQNDNSSPTLTGVTFSSNTAGTGGGGMYNNNGSSPQLAEVTFTGNSTGLYGGGMFNSNNSNPELTDVTFSGNTADDSGGGMHSYTSNPVLAATLFISNTAPLGGGMFNNTSNPTLVNSLFNSNSATDGGGMSNLTSSAVLTNVTFSGNTATGNGGGIVNDVASTPRLYNTLLWGNTAGDSGPQIYDKDDQSYAQGAHCMIPDYSGQITPLIDPDDANPFVDADGPDDIPGNADDDLRLAYTSNAIDSGSATHLPPGIVTDLDGNDRVYGDDVDLGAYEAQCWVQKMHSGYGWLEAGQQYRRDFHAEVGPPATISQTLSSYAAQNAKVNLTTARETFEEALTCAATVTETSQAVAGVLEATWELATGAMLQGNEQLVQVLDVSPSGGSALIGKEIGQLEQAIQLYDEATKGYLEPLASDRYPGFLAALTADRPHPITSTETVSTTLPVDLERLALASAKKSQAYLELAERQFRRGDQVAAEVTLRQGKFQAGVELTLLYTLWPQVVSDTNYIALLRNLSDMDRIYSYLVESKNPLGYGPEFIPFHFDWRDLPENNYEQTRDLAADEWGVADSAVTLAQGKQQEIDDNYILMQDRLADAIGEYDPQLFALCGDATLQTCDSGDIPNQKLKVDEAALRVGLVLQRMENQNELIRIEQDRVAQVAGIRRATARLISNTGEELASLARQEVSLRDSRSTAQGFLGIVGGIFSGATSGAVGGPWAALAGGIFGGLMEAGNWAAEADVAEDLADVAAQKEKLYAKQRAVVQYAEGDIAEADSLARQREYFLRFAELEIEYSIALNNLVQELARMHQLQTQARYLVAEKEKALTFTRLLFNDPAGRVLRDYYMELAHDRYGVALDYAYRAGRALEYEINRDVIFSGLPLTELDDLYPLQDSTSLGAALAQMNTAYNNWKAGKQWQPRTDIVYLSRALGFADHFDPDLGRIVTREEQFNAFVRDPANRVDLDGNGSKESLRFTFQTSIYRGNGFFPTSVYNDKTDYITMRVRGSNLALGREPNWVDIILNQGGTSFIRTGDAFQSGGTDDIRAYNPARATANTQAAIYNNPFPQYNYELASRSVAFTNWTLTINTTEGENQYLNLDNVDEIELWIAHLAISLPQASTLSAQSFEPPPSRAYQPMVHRLESLPFTRTISDPDRRSPAAQSAAIDFNDTYIGTVVISRPLYMPSRDLVLVLNGSGGSITGYISPTLSYPDQGNNQGPAVSGSWSGNSFSLQSEEFHTSLASGVIISRTVMLHSGVISDSGQALGGLYRETLAGLTPQPMEMVGEFRLNRPAHELVAAFTVDVVNPALGQPVSFEDLSLGQPTAWAWDFGDGLTASAQNPTHIYAQTGSYTVTLTVSNDFAADTMIDPNCVIVSVAEKQPIYLPLILKGSP